MKDRKKLAVMIVLGIAVLGIGAFQFVNMSSTPAPAPKVAEKAKEDEQNTPEQAAETTEPTQMVADLYKVGMPVRDPFQEGTLPLAEGMAPPVTTPTPPVPNPVRRPVRHSYSPPPLGGRLEPVNPNGSGLNISPGTPLKNPEEPSYSVSGVITGAKPAAVIVDGSGNQRLVTVGGSLDGDSQLVSVEKGKVTIRHKGKTHTLTVGGTPNAK